MIRFLRRLGLGLAALLLIAAGAVVVFGPARFPRLMSLLSGNATFTIGGPFALTVAANGQPFSDADLRGRWTLIYFGYTFCPDICPTDLAEAIQALSLMGKAGEAIRPIFITVDPARDSPLVMARYVALFSPRLIGLTGSAAAIAQAERAFRVYAEKQPIPHGGGAYLMNHSVFFYLINPKGGIAAILSPDLGTGGMAAAMERALGATPTG